MKRLIIILVATTFTIVAFGQNERKFVRSGNKLFFDAVRDTTKVDSVKFSNAENEYRKALNKKPNDLKWNFNLSDAIYKQQRFEEAAAKFSELGEKLETPVEKARAFHNMGNSELMNQKIDESIEAYKKALRNNPLDLDTKYNLAYAQLLKKKQQEQQQNQNQDQNKDNQDQNKDTKDQNKDQQNKDQQEQNKDQQQRQNKISKENAEQLLQVLQNDERKIQDKVKKEQAALTKRVKTEKEW